MPLLVLLAPQWSPRWWLLWRAPRLVARPSAHRTAAPARSVLATLRGTARRPGRDVALR